MRHRVPRVSAYCLLVLLLLTSVQPAGASGEPTVTAPRTYHTNTQLTITLGDTTATGTGEADYDLEKGAIHTLAITRAEGIEVRLEIYLVGGKLHLYNAQRQQWEYIVVTPADLETLVRKPRVPIHPTASYLQAGTEMIGGDQVLKWRASNAYNILLLTITRGKLTGTLLEESLTAEAFIGAANNYLYRLVTQEQGNTTSYGTPGELDGPIASKTTIDYSKFNQPVTITPPANAVPAPVATPLGGIEPTTALQLKAILERAAATDPAALASLMLAVDLPLSALP